MGIGKMLLQPETQETDKYKPKDRIKFSYVGQVMTYSDPQ